MRTVEILRGRGPHYGPVVDLELNPEIISVTVTVRTALTGVGDATVTLQETDWDHLVSDTWSPMASVQIPEHDERVLTAKVNPASHELVRWVLNTMGGGPFWVYFTANEESE